MSPSSIGRRKPGLSRSGSVEHERIGTAVAHDAASRRRGKMGGQHLRGAGTAPITLTAGNIRSLAERLEARAKSVVFRDQPEICNEAGAVPRYRDNELRADSARRLLCANIFPKAQPVIRGRQNGASAAPRPGAFRIFSTRPRPWKARFGAMKRNLPKAHTLAGPLLAVGVVHQTRQELADRLGLLLQRILLKGPTTTAYVVLGSRIDTSPLRKSAFFFPPSVQ
jgi:hypothetical protein